jgi:hypothetical protein
VIEEAAFFSTGNKRENNSAITRYAHRAKKQISNFSLGGKSV